jgi:hypothetical protein
MPRAAEPDASEPEGARRRLPGDAAGRCGHRLPGRGGRHQRPGGAAAAALRVVAPAAPLRLLVLADCPPEVGEVLELGASARRDSEGAFSVYPRRARRSGRVRSQRCGEGATERAAEALRALTGTDFCLSAGGDIVCRTSIRTTRPGGSASRTSRPASAGRRRARDHGAVATSGSAHRGGHLVDARTGQARPASMPLPPTRSAGRPRPGCGPAPDGAASWSGPTGRRRRPAVAPLRRRRQ